MSVKYATPQYLGDNKMRIVYDIEGRFSPVLSGNAYSVMKGKKGYPGYFKVELSLCAEDDVIEIEGNSKAIRDALNLAVVMIDEQEKMIKQEWPKLEWWEKCNPANTK